MRKFIYWAVVILWMAIIFSLSHQPANDSDKLSNSVTDTIVSVVEKVLPHASIDKDLNHLVRKNAHFFIYFVLGLILISVLKKMGVKGGRGIVIAWMVCVLFAITDEVHQLFVLGRGAQVRDVIIDSAGAAIGIGIYKFFKWVTAPKKNLL